jgi:hypothetical protein
MKLIPPPDIYNYDNLLFNRATLTIPASWNRAENWLEGYWLEDTAQYWLLGQAFNNYSLRPYPDSFVKIRI